MNIEELINYQREQVRYGSKMVYGWEIATAQQKEFDVYWRSSYPAVKLEKARIAQKRCKQVLAALIMLQRRMKQG